MNFYFFFISILILNFYSLKFLKIKTNYPLNLFSPTNSLLIINCKKKVKHNVKTKTGSALAASTVWRMSAAKRELPKKNCSNRRESLWQQPCSNHEPPRKKGCALAASTVWRMRAAKMELPQKTAATGERVSGSKRVAATNPHESATPYLRVCAYTV